MSVRILAVDVSSEYGSIALIEDGRVLEEVALQSADGFAHILFGEIEKLLARHSVSLTSIDVFASAAGPGSFTGVRVGLSAVKGLAEATGRKVIAISNLHALAFFGTRPLRATLIDARRSEIFGAVYDADLRPVHHEVVMKLDAWLQSLPPDAEIITTYQLEGATVAPHALAAAIGLIAASNPDLAQDPDAIDANYVRRSDAELLWKE